MLLEVTSGVLYILVFANAAPTGEPNGNTTNPPPLMTSPSMTERRALPTERRALPGLVQCLQDHLGALNTPSALAGDLDVKQLDAVCREVPLFRRCTASYRQGAARFFLDSLLGGLDFLCGASGRQGLQKHGSCIKGQSTEIQKCQAALSTTGSWTTMTEFTSKSEDALDQCRVLKSVVTCTQRAVRAACGEDAQYWIRDFLRRTLRPYKEIIPCDVYGPTGGVAGLVAGIIVSIFTLVSCGILICCQKSKDGGRKGKKGTPSRNSTSL